jgi:hypothetical protein
VGLEEVDPVSESAGSKRVCVVRLAGEESPQALSLTLTALSSDSEEVRQVSFPASAGPHRECVAVSISDDDVVKYDETIRVSLTASGGGSLAILPSSITIPILDDDIAVSWERTEHNVLEDVGSVELCAVLEGAKLSHSVTLTFRVRGRNGATTADYSLSRTQLVFEAEGSRRECVRVDIADDSAVEDTESVTVALRTSDDEISLTSSVATVTIRDNGDIVYVGPEENQWTVQENKRGLLTICVEISGNLERDFDLNLKLNNGTAREGLHFDSSRSLLAITVNHQLPTGHCFGVRIINNNVYDVADMEFTGTLSTADPAVRLNPSTFSIRIRDDDAASLIISFSQRVFTGYEGNSSMSACATIIRGQLGAGSHVDVNITTNTDTIDVDARVAVEGRDYGEAERIIRFDSSHTPESEPQCLEIPILEDEVLEDGETYFVELFKVDKRQDFLLRPFTVRAVIEDNDSVTATVETAEVMALEPVEGKRTYAKACLVILGEREIDLQMKATPKPFNATAGKDYNKRPIPFTFAHDQTKACVDVRILNDFLLEALYERFFVDFSSKHSKVIFEQKRVVATIVDTDILRYQILYVPQLLFVDESQYCSHNSTGQFCITISGRLDIDVTISFLTVDGSAVAGEDYIPLNQTVVLGPEDILNDRPEGVWYGCIDYCTKDDNIVEGDESFFVVMSPHTDRVQPSENSADRIEVTIQDNDAVRVSPIQTELTVSEGEGQINICVNMEGLTERAVDLAVKTVDHSATEGVDYEILNNTIHFPSYLTTYGHLTAAQVSQFIKNPPPNEACVAIRIIDDNVLERVASKTFVVNFTSDSLAENRINVTSGVTVTIQDDDQVILSLDAPSAVVVEGDQRARILLVLDGAAEFPISARIETRSGDGPSMYMKLLFELSTTIHSLSRPCHTGGGLHCGRGYCGGSPGGLRYRGPSLHRADGLHQRRHHLRKRRVLRGGSEYGERGSEAGVSLCQEHSHPR